MARNESCHSPLEVRRDTLMPVSPNSERVSESLSHHGETEALMDLDTTEGNGAQARAATLLKRPGGKWKARMVETTLEMTMM